MDQILMSKNELLGIIKANRDKHNQVFLEALEGYRKMAIAELEKSLEEARRGKKVRRSLTMVEPMDMTKAYDQTIAMLKHHKEDTITITRTEYRNYVLDEWHWTKDWATSNRSYTTSDAAVDYLSAKAGEQL